MSAELENQSSTLGVPIDTVLKNADQKTLFDLLGPSIVNMLKILEPDLISGGKLGEFASKLLDGSELLIDKNKRRLLLGSMSQAKIHELANRMGLKRQNVQIDDILENSLESDSLPILFTFFGIVRNESLQGSKEASTKKIVPSYSLFKHQREVAEKVIETLDKHPYKVVLHMPTGAGKTRTAMHVVATHLRKHENSVVVWLAHNAELLEQAANEFEKSWAFLGNREVDVVRFWGNRNPNIESITNGIIVAGLLKMSNLKQKNFSVMLGLADRTMLTVVDEAHQAIAQTFSSVIETLQTKRPKSKLLGLTATPGRSWLDINEDQVLADFFDRQKVTMEIVGYSNPVKYLIEKKYLAKPVFKQLKVNFSSEISESEIQRLHSDIDISEDMLKQLGSDIERNCQIVNAVEDLLIRHNRVIVFSPSVENARLLAAILTLRRYETHLILGESNSMERNRMIRRFRNKSIDSIVLVNYGVLTTGFDAPNLSAAVIARPTKSLVLYSQMVGRATRGTKSGGSDEAEIVTIIDTNLPGFGSMEESFKFWEDVWEN